jgi:capsular polysaccharide biosynthesis protein
LGIALLSGFLAFSGGIGSVSVAEYLDQTIRGSRGIIAVFQAPPLAVIPLIQVKGKGKKKRA